MAQPAVAVAAWIERFGRVQRLIGGDAQVLDVVAGGGEVAGHRHRQPAAIPQGEQRLDQALAEGPAPREGGAPPVLQGPGQDLARTRRAPVHQGQHRSGEEAAGIGLLEAGDAATVLRFHDGAAIEQFIGYCHAGAHQATGVVAQIEDQALHRRTAVAAVQVLDGLPHQLGHRFTELGDAQVAQAVPPLQQATVAHRLQIHLASLQPHLSLGGASGLPQADQHFAAGFPPQPCRRGLEPHRDRRASIDAQHLGA